MRGTSHTQASATRTVTDMSVRLDAVGLVVADMPASLSFYRRLGLQFPPSAGEDGQVEVTLPGGVRLLFDTIDTIRSFDPTWRPPAGGHRIGLAFACRSPSEVDQIHADLVAAGYANHLDPFDAF